MSAGKISHLITVKQALAEKYAGRAQRTSSRPLKQRMLNRAEKYRRQATRLAEQLG